MDQRTGINSQTLLKRLRDALAEAGEGQERLDRITYLIALSLDSEVCSIYLKRDETTLELCATYGLKAEAVHQTKLRMGQGLVGRVAENAVPLNRANAPAARGFRYMPETGEEVYSSFVGVPIQRLGEVLGVLVVQSKIARSYSDDEIYGLEVVAMVIAEMTELGAFTGPDKMSIAAQHRLPFFVRGLRGQEGVAEGVVLLHEPHIVIANPVADDPLVEAKRMQEALDMLVAEIDEMLERGANTGEQRDVMVAYRLFAQDKGWRNRMFDSIDSGLAAEVAVEKEQSSTRTRMARMKDAYLRERLHDLDDLANRLLRILTGREDAEERGIPENAILVARSIGPGELLDYGNKLKGVVLEEGSVGSHAAVVARSLAIPLVIHAKRITREALSGDPILVDGETGNVHLRPEDTVATAFREKIAMQAEAQEAYKGLRDMPATTLDGVTIALHMNGGLMVDLPSLGPSGAEGVGLYRTELQFLIRSRVPQRGELRAIYSKVMDSAGEKPVVFRTLDIGSDKALPYMRRPEEPNPALGWRAIRIGLDRPGVMRMQLQALIRAANGRRLNVMFPFIAQFEEFRRAREMLLSELEREARQGHILPANVRIGAMLETPSLAFAPDQFFELADFISIGGNDLKQFFFAADRENELVRQRYDTLNVSYLTFIEQIARRCTRLSTPLSFCGEDAGRPIEALALVAMGLRTLSMRPASVGPVKRLLRMVNLSEVRRVIDEARVTGEQSVRRALVDWLGEQDFPL